MTRIAALFAIIAFALMSAAMARAQPMAASDMAMPGMAGAHHGAKSTTDRQTPCEQALTMSCNACCIAMPPIAPEVSIIALRHAGFTPADLLPQTGRAVPPALPPPRT